MKETTYIYPPRPEQSLPPNETQLLADLKWIAQYKYNDTRIIIKLHKNNSTTIWNRHKQQLNYNQPTELQEQLLQIHKQLGLNKYHILDGGLIHNKHKAIKNTIVIWDILTQNNEHLLGTTYQERYNKIQGLTNGLAWVHNNKQLLNSSDDTNYTIGSQITKDIFIPTCWEPNNWTKCWSLINNINKPWVNNGNDPIIEGLMLKDPNGKLTQGLKEKNNSDWMIRSRIKTGRHNF